MMDKKTPENDINEVKDISQVHVEDEKEKSTFESKLDKVIALKEIPVKNAKKNSDGRCCIIC